MRGFALGGPWSNLGVREILFLIFVDFSNPDLGTALTPVTLMVGAVPTPTVGC